MTTAHELADVFIAAAEANYRRDGSLAPALIMITQQRQVYLGLAATDDVPMTGSAVLASMASAVRPDFVALISEVWRSGVPVDEFDEDNYERGELGRREEAGDASVMTALMVHVLDCKHYETSHLILVTDHGDHMDREMDDVGLGQGRVPDLLVSALEFGLSREPHTFDLTEIAKGLGGLGYITALAVEERE